MRAQALPTRAESADDRASAIHQKAKARTAASRAVGGPLRVRWFVRMPIWLYRARLGAIFGGRLLMLKHVGAQGVRRYRDVEADPRVHVYLRSRPIAAEARPLDA